MNYGQRWKWVAVGGFLIPALIFAGLAGCAKHVVAKVNGKNLTAEEFYRRMEREVGARTLQVAILEKLMEEEAQKRNLSPSEAEIQAEMRRFKEQFPDEQAYFQFLKLNGLDEDDLRAQIRIQMIEFNLRTAHLKPTEEDLRRFFAENRAMFDRPEQIRFRQIVLQTKEKADRVYQRLVEGMDFVSLVEADSIDPEAQRTKGEVGPIAVEWLKQNVPPIYEVVSKLKPEEVSRPIEHNGRFFILKMLQHLDPQPAVFEERKEDVRQAYLGRNAIPQEELLQQLARRAQVIIVEPRYRALEQFFGPQMPSYNLPLPGAEEGGVPEELLNPPMVPPTPLPGEEVPPTLPAEEGGS
ncbi:MAG TPA: hypothetical protein EYP85_08900 [Armatimonadetes bacterium]|nr:hypothetical protein [Armatimonadota bacterium]